MVNGTSKLRVCFHIYLGLKTEVLKACSLVGSITNVVLNVAHKAGIR